MQKVVPCVFKKQFLKNIKKSKHKQHKSKELNNAVFRNGKMTHGVATEVCSGEYNRPNLNSASCPSLIKPCHRLQINAENNATL